MYVRTCVRACVCMCMWLCSMQVTKYDPGDKVKMIDDLAAMKALLINHGEWTDGMIPVSAIWSKTKRNRKHAVLVFWPSRVPG